MNGLERAISHFENNQTALAQALGIHRANISNWKKRGVPAVWAPKIEAVTNGAVTCAEIRPDVFRPAA